MSSNDGVRKIPAFRFSFLGCIGRKSIPLLTFPLLMFIQFRQYHRFLESAGQLFVEKPLPPAGAVLAPFSAATAAANNTSNNDTIAACLLVMDDTIKLTEWLAYHYTVLPLGDLIVAIDPLSHKTGKIMSILEQWKDRTNINITVWTNDTWLANIPPNEGWGRTRIRVGEYAQHKRRQQLLTHLCMKEFQGSLENKNTWVLLTDTDEFLMYNYVHESIENWTDYSVARPRYNREHIDRARSNNRILRSRLPPKLNESISTFLRRHESRLGRCIRLPALDFGMNESTPEEIQSNVPLDVVDPRHLMTLRHRKHGTVNKGQSFSKVMVNLNKVHPSWLNTTDAIETIHNPNNRICGNNGPSTSGTDYIASLFRIQHYVGTHEAYAERHLDVRKNRADQKHLHNKNQGAAPHIPMDDIRPWISLFVDKVGKEEARRLLEPLRLSYTGGSNSTGEAEQ